MSHPKETAKLIEEAATSVSEQPYMAVGVSKRLHYGAFFTSLTTKLRRANLIKTSG
jgi:hypothetical protein